MKRDSLLPFLKESTIGSYPEVDETNPHLQT
jgi:hypothetical protein